MSELTSKFDKIVHEDEWYGERSQKISFYMEEGESLDAAKLRIMNCINFELVPAITDQLFKDMDDGWKNPGRVEVEVDINIKGDYGIGKHVKCYSMGGCKCTHCTGKK